MAKRVVAKVRTNRDFPTKRLRAAGASADEIAVIRSEFERSDVSMQRSLVDHFGSVATGDLRDYLAQKRANGDFGEDAERAYELPEDQDGPNDPEGGADDSGDENPEGDQKGPESESEAGSGDSATED